MNDPKKLSAIILCLIVVGLGFYLIPAGTDKFDKNAVAPDFVPQYSLINQDGEPVSEKTYADTYQLVYFGFTFCPEICPTELQKMTVALNELEPSVLEKIQPIFITVDPARDTPEVMKEYLKSFHPRFVGFTGTEDTVDVAIDGFKIYAAKVDDPSLSDYTINHSSYIYLIAPSGDLIALYKKEDSADDIAQGIRQAVGQ
ncbi:MAG: hypothetical protein CMH25_04435 [Micavibrio sp.]|nr:hypothetical protein [Micavibrio sp.]|tara:strand:- start:188633 stop:189232 length:600 start_codon:yes stop_codon:yes gene_type:complete